MSRKMSAIGVALTTAILAIAMALPANAVEGGSVGDPREGVEILQPIFQGLVLPLLNALGGSAGPLGLNGLLTGIFTLLNGGA